MIDAALLHDGIRRKTRFDLCINGKVRVRDRAVPDIVIALSAPDESAPVLLQDISDFLFVFSHYAESLSYLSIKKRIPVAAFW